MNRIDRLVATLIHLQSKRVVKAEEIATRFDISVRTVYRDIRALEEAGVPIGAEAGVGYFIAEGYQLPPVVFTKFEAAALLTGEKLLEKLADKSLVENYFTAMRKVRAVLKHKDKEFIESLDGSLAVYSPISSRQLQQEQFPNRFAANIQEALATSRVVEMEYYSSYSNTYNRRTTEPIGLFYLNSNWHLVAWCRLRKDFRDFRMDRIKSLTVLEETFAKRAHHNLQTYFDKIMVEQSVEKVCVRFENKVANYMAEQKYHYGLVEEKRGETHTDMIFYTSSLEYFAHWLMIWGNAVQIQSPPQLKTLVVKYIEELRQHYQEKE